jgi:hypothetical protein
MCSEAQVLGVNCFLAQAHASQGRGGEDDTGDACIVGGMSIALQEIPGHDLPLHPGDRRQGEAPTDNRISSGIDCRIRHTLQVGVDRGTFFLACYPCRIQIEVVDLRHASGSLHDQIGLSEVLLGSYLSMDKQMGTLPFDGGHGCAQVNLNTQFASVLHQLGNQVRIEPGEGACSPVENLGLDSCACRNVRKLEGDDGCRTPLAERAYYYFLVVRLYMLKRPIDGTGCPCAQRRSRSISTPFQNAMYPLIFLASGLGLG